MLWCSVLWWCDVVVVWCCGGVMLWWCDVVVVWCCGGVVLWCVVLRKTYNILKYLKRKTSASHSHWLEASHFSHCLFVCLFGCSHISHQLSVPPTPTAVSRLPQLPRLATVNFFVFLFFVCLFVCLYGRARRNRCRSELWLITAPSRLVSALLFNWGSKFALCPAWHWWLRAQDVRPQIQRPAFASRGSQDFWINKMVDTAKAPISLPPHGVFCT